jgi:hypothetical protein
MQNRGLTIGMSFVMGLGSPAAFGRVERVMERPVTVIGRGRHVGRPGVVVVDRRYGPGWGAVAAATAAGVALGAAATAAAEASRQRIVETPVVGTVVPALPVGCVTVVVPGGVVYNCNSVYYQPVYVGGTIMYQVVPPVP